MIESRKLYGYDRGMTEYTIHCDGCPSVYIIETDGWGRMLELMKRRGWRSRKIGGNWEHHCASCAAPGAVFVR